MEPRGPVDLFAAAPRGLRAHRPRPGGRPLARVHSIRTPQRVAIVATGGAGAGGGRADRAVPSTASRTFVSYQRARPRPENLARARSAIPWPYPDATWTAATTLRRRNTPQTRLEAPVARTPPLAPLPRRSSHPGTRRTRRWPRRPATPAPRRRSPRGPPRLARGPRDARAPPAARALRDANAPRLDRARPPRRPHVSEP